MPFTPYHLGPGLFLKSLAPSRISLSAFAVSQVVIDAEVLVRAASGAGSLHGPLHSLALGGPIGLAAGLAVHLAARASGRNRSRGELGLGSAVLGGLAGGASHPLLDGLMHADVLPFWPGSTTLAGAAGLDPGAVPLGCLLLGIAGGGVLLWRRWRTGRRLPE